MTEREFVEDLRVLLREGMVCVDLGDDDGPTRFRPTPRGLEESQLPVEPADPEESAS